MIHAHRALVKARKQPRCKIDAITRCAEYVDKKIRLTSQSSGLDTLVRIPAYMHACSPYDRDSLTLVIAEILGLHGYYVKILPLHILYISWAPCGL